MATQVFLLSWAEREGVLVNKFIFIHLGWRLVISPMVQNLPAMQETRVRSLGLGRSPGRGHGSPLQYSCLENPTDRGAWRAAVHGVARSRTRLSIYHFQFSLAGDPTPQSRPCSHLPAGVVPGSECSPPAARLACTSRCTSPHPTCLHSHSARPWEPASPGPRSPLLPEETSRHLDYCYVNNISLKMVVRKWFKSFET